ncbi:hypothetical protein [Saccharothrix syringae]|uniref:Uncharacterized protein n=1 Tax=Saccharothrix syringae TaxID=103733 RepID=A0A5Q0H2M7_SACSY|nr:hypothetical protein [Saccharothrix syringae]QFZ20468.1 hypothetical protein EKG83_26375 [Saccharothrix syringae]
MSAASIHLAVSAVLLRELLASGRARDTTSEQAALVLSGRGFVVERHQVSGNGLRDGMSGALVCTARDLLVGAGTDADDDAVVRWALDRFDGLRVPGEDGRADPRSDEDVVVGRPEGAGARLTDGEDPREWVRGWLWTDRARGRHLVDLLWITAAGRYIECPAALAVRWEPDDTPPAHDTDRPWRWITPEQAARTVFEAERDTRDELADDPNHAPQYRVAEHELPPLLRAARLAGRLARTLPVVPAQTLVPAHGGALTVLTDPHLLVAAEHDLAVITRLVRDVLQADLGALRRRQIDELVERTGSVTGAATLLGVRPNTLSRQRSGR